MFGYNTLQNFIVRSTFYLKTFYSAIIKYINLTTATVQF
jgi:hypothetical protein